MTFELLSNVFVRSCYKYHPCSWCGELINKGHNAMCRSYKLDGELVTDWMHMDCYKAMLEMPNDELEEGWSEGDFVRGTTIRVDEGI